MTAEQLSDPITTPDFDVSKLDALLEVAGVDALVATSRHNVRYLSGSYSMFFAYNPAISDEQYLSAIAYVRGQSEQAVLVCSPQEADEFEVERPWVPTVDLTSFTTLETAQGIAARLIERGLDRATLGIEEPFVPFRFQRELARRLPHATFVDVTPELNELRAVKRPYELALLRGAAERVVDAMAATMTGAGVGATTREIYDRLAAEEGGRGLTFEYCVIATGTSLNRAPSSRVWKRGEILSLDSGGTYNSYLADMTRMAVAGEPTARMRDLLGQVDAVQQAVFDALRVGVTGREMLETARTAVAGLPDAAHVTFNMHGVGLVRREAPRVDFGGTVKEEPPGLDEPFEADMVLSVETNLPAPDVGLVKLEDIVAITPSGYEAFGHEHRGWTVVGG